MIKNLKMVKSLFIVGSLLLSIFIVISPVISAKSDFELLNKETNNGGTGGLLSFPAYIYITTDESALKKPLIIDQSVTVPINITYKHGVPKQLYNLIPGQLIKNQFFFGSAMAPQIQITLSVVEKPDWANIYFTQPSVLMDMPMPEEKSTISTELVISPYREAPARPYTITILASSNAAGKVQSFTLSKSITFTPSYIPMINVEVEKPMREVSPKETVNFIVKVTNNANKNTIVKFSYNAPKEWAPIINPREIELPPLGIGEATFSVQAPYGIGWHDKTTSMEIICQPYPSPISGEDLSKYEIAAQTADIRVTNYGFSIAGIEPFLVLLVIIVIALAIVWSYQKKKNKLN